MANYIDRQAALNALCDNCDTVQSVCPHFPCKRYTSVEALPSADVQPVRHGHWVFGNTLGHSWMKCSECLVSQNGQTATYTYCPNCNARMDGD